MPATFICGFFLIVTMLLLAWQTWTSDPSYVGRSGVTPADY